MFQENAQTVTKLVWGAVPPYEYSLWAFPLYPNNQIKYGCFLFICKYLMNAPTVYKYAYTLIDISSVFQPSKFLCGKLSRA